jgi:hypothetical protein
LPSPLSELLCPFSSPGRTCKPKCWWFFFFPLPFSRALQKHPDVFCSCVSSSVFEIRVCFELQNSTAISELETTYTDIQGFLSASDSSLGSCWWRMHVLMKLQNLQFCWLLSLLFGVWGCGMCVGGGGVEWRCPECDGAGFVRKPGTKLNANAARKDLSQIVCKRCNGLGKIGNMSCSCCSSSHNFSLIFSGSRLEIWDWSCISSFHVFGSTICLIYNPTLNGISQVSRMARFWRGRGFWIEREREVWNSGIHTLDLWLHLQVKLTKPDWLMSSTAPDAWIFCWGWLGDGVGLQEQCKASKCCIIFTRLCENIETFWQNVLLAMLCELNTQMER